jgi:hypothetical protein
MKPRLESGRCTRVRNMAMIVRDQLAGLHNGAGLQPDLAAGRHLCAQHVAGGNLRQAFTLLQSLGLRSLACSGWTQKD